MGDGNKLLLHSSLMMSKMLIFISLLIAMNGRETCKNSRSLCICLYIPIAIFCTDVGIAVVLIVSGL